MSLNVSELVNYICDNPKMIEEAQTYLKNPDNLDTIAKVITHFVFRIGPVEDMHSNNQLSQEDMYTLNKFVCNRVAYIIQCLQQEEYVKLAYLVNNPFSQSMGSNWDKVKPDGKDCEAAMEYFLNNAYTQYKNERRKIALTRKTPI